MQGMQKDLAKKAQKVTKMKLPPIELGLCYDDSPRVREDISAHEASINSLENSVKLLVKHLKAATDHGKEFNKQMSHFSDELIKLSKLETIREDHDIENGFQKFGESLKELENQRQILLGQTHGLLIEPLENFLKYELVDLREKKKKFESAADDYHSAQAKYLSKKSKDATIPDAAQETAEARKAFHEKSLEYGVKLNSTHSRKPFEFLEKVLSYMFAQSAFLHHGFDLMKNIEPCMRDLTAHIQQGRTAYEKEILVLEAKREKILMDTLDMYNPMTSRQTSGGVKSPILQKEGYLFLKSSTRIRTVWNRHYFSAANGQLTYVKSKERMSMLGRLQASAGVIVEEEEEPQITAELRLCTVKVPDNPDRRFCFDLISPQKTLSLQAENDEEMHEWVEVLQHGISEALNSLKPLHKAEDKESSRDGLSGASTGVMSKSSDELENKVNDDFLTSLKHVTGNSLCADCKAPDPVWASINLGIVLCIDCSGIHRSMGTHVSKVRSLTLDKWEPEIRAVMLAIGNEKSNAVFEAAIRLDSDKYIPPELTYPNPAMERPKKELWIQAKYKDRRFVLKDPEMSSEDINHALCEAAGRGDFANVVKYIAWGAAIDAHDSLHDGCTPLHAAVSRGDQDMYEFLCQWSCNLDAVDNKGWTALHYAVSVHSTRHVMALMKRGAKSNIKDNDDKDPLDLAVELAQESETEENLNDVTDDESGESGAISPKSHAIMEILMILRMVRLDPDIIWRKGHSGLNDILAGVGSGGLPSNPGSERGSSPANVPSGLTSPPINPTPVLAGLGSGISFSPVFSSMPPSMGSSSFINSASSASSSFNSGSSSSSTSSSSSSSGNTSSSPISIPTSSSGNKSRTGNSFSSGSGYIGSPLSTSPAAPITTSAATASASAQVTSPRSLGSSLLGLMSLGSSSNMQLSDKSSSGSGNDKPGLKGFESSNPWS